MLNKILKHIAFKRYLAYMQMGDHRDLSQQWELAERVLQKTTMVYAGSPNQRDLPIEYQVFIDLLQSKGALPFILKGLSSDRPQVVGYCLAALSRANNPSEYADKLPKDLFQREEVVTWRVGSFFQTLPLKDLAHQILDV